MNYTTLLNTIVDRFKTSFLDVNSLSVDLVEYDNHTITKPDVLDKNSCWFRVVVIPGEESQVQFGNPKTFRLVGVLAVQIFASPTFGTNRASSLATLVANAYRAVTLPGIVFRTPSPRRLGLEPGGWYQWNVNCPFLATYTE